MASTLNIAHIDTGRELRGGQEQLLSLARGLLRRGHSQLVACPEGSPLEARARQEGLRVLPLPGASPCGLRGVLRLRGQLRAGSFEVVHAHDARGQTLSWLASAGSPVRRVASRLVAFPPRHPAIHRFKYTRTCHGVIALSHSVRGVLLAAGVPDDRIEIIPAGIDLPPELPSRELRQRVRTAWGVGDADFVTGHVGAFTAEKGQDVALDAVVLVARRVPRFRLFLAGDGPLRTAFATVAKARLAGDAVRLLGFVENLEEFFAGLDLFIMPSRSEAWGLVALHAMARGLPVVASRVGGLPEIVEDGATGWLVPPASPEALADAIAKAAADPERLRLAGRNARARAYQFSIDLTVERTEAFYRRLLARPGAAELTIGMFAV